MCFLHPHKSDVTTPWNTSQQLFLLETLDLKGRGERASDLAWDFHTSKRFEALSKIQALLHCSIH